LDNALNNHELAKRFLLGNLSESERSEIEDSFLSQDDFYQELLIAEDDLIDAYVRGELPASERALFEQRRLTSPHPLERVKFARTLFNSVSEKAAAVPSARAPRRASSWRGSLAGGFFTRRPALALAFAAALFVIILGGLWFMTGRRRVHPAPEQVKTIQPTTVTPTESPASQAPAEVPQRAPDEERATARETPKRAAPVIATFTLLPGLVRGGRGAGPLVLPAGATEVRLRLTLEGEAYEKYRATLSTPEGRGVWTQDVTNRPSLKSTHVSLGLPADLLKDGDYVLDLSGVTAAGKWESVADYSFRIVRK